MRFVVVMVALVLGVFGCANGMTSPSPPAVVLEDAGTAPTVEPGPPTPVPSDAGPSASPVDAGVPAPVETPSPGGSETPPPEDSGNWLLQFAAMNNTTIPFDLNQTDLVWFESTHDEPIDPSLTSFSSLTVPPSTTAHGLLVAVRVAHPRPWDLDIRVKGAATELIVYNPSFGDLPEAQWEYNVFYVWAEGQNANTSVDVSGKWELEILDALDSEVATEADSGLLVDWTIVIEPSAGL